MQFSGAPVKSINSELPQPHADEMKNGISGQSMPNRNGDLNKRDTILIALDGGGTRTRCAAFDRSGKICSQAESGPSNHLVIGNRYAFESLTECVSQVLRASGTTPEQVDAVSVGLAGVDLDGEGLVEAKASLLQMCFKNCIVNADILTAHAGALAGYPGVVALAGTGSAFFGVTANGDRAKAGAWGPAFGDEGSAFWIGQRVLQAASSAFDGRGPNTLLVRLVCDELGIDDFSKALHPIYHAQKQVRMIADLARTADAAAEAGDQVALEILQRAGDELACGTGAVIRVLNFDPSDCRVSWEGSVIRNSVKVRERFCSTLGAAFPGVSIVPPRFDPVHGAYLIGCKSLGWEAHLE
jgi:N-acetylglucosamine kinase-like BadF-type ATPase